MYDQNKGSLLLEYHSDEPECPACVGAWLAYVLMPPWKQKEDGFDFLVGIARTSRALGVGETTLTLLLRAAGAPSLPFSDMPWPEPAPTVFRRLGYSHRRPGKIAAGELHIHQERKTLWEHLITLERMLGKIADPAHWTHGTSAKDEVDDPYYRRPVVVVLIRGLAVETYDPKLENPSDAIS